MSERAFRLPSQTEEEVLGLLLKKEMYGLEMVKESDSLTRGGVYVILGRMEDKGLVTSRSVGPDDAGRRVYSITTLGKTAYEALQKAQAVFGKQGRR